MSRLSNYEILCISQYRPFCERIHFLPGREHHYYNCWTKWGSGHTVNRHFCSPFKLPYAHFHHKDTEWLIIGDTTTNSHASFNRGIHTFIGWEGIEQRRDQLSSLTKPGPMHMMARTVLGWRRIQSLMECLVVWGNASSADMSSCILNSFFLIGGLLERIHS